MLKNELEILHKHIDSSTMYLEFGSGESTVYAAGAKSIKHIDSVESSEEFVEENLKSKSVVVEALESGKLTLNVIDIGKTGLWGFPVNKEKKHLWPNYSLSVFSKKSEHDLVLVDGRFRIACTLNAILNTPRNCKIIIHDFWISPEYHKLLRYLDLLERADTIAVFSKKKNISAKKIRRLIKKYQYMPGDRTMLERLRDKIIRMLHGRM